MSHCASVELLKCPVQQHLTKRTAVHYEDAQQTGTEQHLSTERKGVCKKSAAKTVINGDIMNTFAQRWGAGQSWPLSLLL